MEIFLYFMIFLSLFHTFWTKKIENPACAKHKLPDNLEVFDCKTENTDAIVICKVRCKIGYNLKEDTTAMCLAEERRWFENNNYPSCIEADRNCPYPPRLGENLTVKECILRNGIKTNCTLSCENEKYRFMNGDKEIFCNFKTGKWAQEKSPNIATTCQQVNPVCEKNRLPDNLQVYDCQYGKTSQLINCKARCKFGYTLKGTHKIVCRVNSKKWFYDGTSTSCTENIVCDMKKLPDNLEIYDCKDKDKGRKKMCLTRCKIGYKLKGAHNFGCLTGQKKWWILGHSPVCIELDIDCPYPPKLVENLSVKECIETNGKKSNCTLSCENEKYRFMNGDKKIFCNLRTGKWIQEKSTHIATTCQQEFDCKFCDSLRCPSTTNKKCKKLTKKCSCSCPHWDSCDGFKCPKDKPMSYCLGITNKPGTCSCR